MEFIVTRYKNAPGSRNQYEQRNLIKLTTVNTQIKWSEVGDSIKLEFCWNWNRWELRKLTSITKSAYTANVYKIWCSFFGFFCFCAHFISFEAALKVVVVFFLFFFLALPMTCNFAISEVRSVRWKQFTFHIKHKARSTTQQSNSIIIVIHLKR